MPNSDATPKEQAVNEIHVQGARALGEALKVNTTLVTLTLESVQQQQQQGKVKQ